jgi:hypothetical protein
MNSAITFVELENRVVSATYRNLMIGAKIVLIDKMSGEFCPELVTKITSPMPNGSLRISLPAAMKPGGYYLRALNGHGEFAAQSLEFLVG